MQQANAVISVQEWHRRKWDDKPNAATVGAKLFRLELVFRYTGDIEGESSMQCLITQNEDGKGNLVALEKVTGSVGGRTGSFVFQHVGDFDNSIIRRTLTVMPGSGTGELGGIQGEAVIHLSEHEESYPVEFKYVI